MPPTIRSSGLIRPKIRPIYQQALSPQSGTGRKIAGKTAPHRGYGNEKGEIPPPHEGSRQTRASRGRDLEATLTPLPSRARRRPSPTPLVLPCQAERGCPQRRSGARPLEQVNAVLSRLASCIQAGTQLDRPGSPASTPRSFWASQPPRPELGCLLGAAALLIRLVLQGPQGAQRPLFVLGQTPDARDSESLVRPVATQGAQGFAATHIPEPDGPIIAATGEPVAIATDLGGLPLP